MKMKNLLILMGILAILLIVAKFARDPFEGIGNSRKDNLYFPGIDSTNVTKMEFIGGRGENVVLEKQLDQWVVATSDYYRADPQAISLVFSKLQNATVGNIVSRNPQKQSIFEVDSTGIETKLYGQDNEELAHFYIGKGGPDWTSTYVRQFGSDDVVLVNDCSRYVFDKGNNNWRDKTIVKLDRDSITRLAVKEKRKEQIEFLKADDGNWEIQTPIKAKAKTTMVNNMLSVLSNLTTSDWADPNDSNALGFDNPELTISAVAIDGTTTTIIVGAKKDERNQVHVRKEGDANVYLVYDGRFNNFKKELSEFKEEEKQEDES